MNARRTSVIQWLARLYALALRLYPAGVRQEYADEMQYVFYQKALDVAQRGNFGLARFACREARDLPGSILRSHLNERKGKMKLAAGDDVNGGPLNAWKVAAVFLPFALTVLLSVGNKINPTFFTVLGLTLFGLLIAIWIAGLTTALPIWTLPSLGMLLFILYFYCLKLIPQVFLFLVVMLPLFGGWPEGLALGIPMLLLISFGAILSMAVALFILLLLNPKFRDRVRKDWTQLSFLLYGMAMMPMFMNDEFHHLAEYQLTSVLFLAVGAGLYLKAKRRWQRILALIFPVVISQGILILGLYQTYPLEPWISLTDPTQRVWEALQPLSDPLAALLLLPALVHLIPWKAEPEATFSGEPRLPA